MSVDLESRVAALRRSAVFGALDEPFLTRLAASMSEVTFPAGRVLIEPRAPGSGMFVIDEGTVIVQPRDVEPVELGPGEVVGELALLTADGTTDRARAGDDRRPLPHARPRDAAAGARGRAEARDRAAADARSSASPRRSSP